MHLLHVTCCFVNLGISEFCHQGQCFLFTNKDCCGQGDISPGNRTDFLLDQRSIRNQCDTVGTYISRFVLCVAQQPVLLCVVLLCGSLFIGLLLGCLYCSRL